MMHQERIDNPTAEALRLQANPELLEKAPAARADASYQVSLSTNTGYFVLSWSATVTGTYDWIGLYQNADLPDSDYIGGNNWQWAVRGSSYKTATPAQVGYQARYLVWDARAGAYKSVARSKPWGL
ncbi:MAG TPA: hypothetical protein VN253_02115 [Kofleriaceae bacterium]|nr:hypothetical protein [Kofleriaceae bacterium]